MPSSRLKRTAERLLGLVTDATRDLRDAEVGRREQLGREVHPPVRQVPDRRTPEHLPEPLVEERARGRGLHRGAHGLVADEIYPVVQG